MTEWSEQVEQLLAPRRAHGRPATPAYAARARRIRERCRRAGMPLIELEPEEFVSTLIPLGGAASWFNVVLDTTAPGGVTLALNGNATYTTSQSITAAVGTSDTPTTGYQIKIWGDVDTTDNASIQATEAASSWITPASFTANQAVKLSSGDGSKTINAKVRDDVWNESAAVTKSITLDTTSPVVTIVSGPDTAKVSTISGKRVVTFGWQVDSAFEQYEVEVVASSGAVRGSGTVIGTTNGSTNTNGSAGGYPATTTITSTIDARDLAAASPGDATKVIKIFAKDAAGLWSS